MRRPSNLLSFSVILVAGVLLVGQPSLAQSADGNATGDAPATEDAISLEAEALTGRLMAISSLHAEFTQQDAGAAGDQQSGEFWLKKPDQFRFESGEPLNQTIVSDGIFLWTHDRDLEQVIVADLEARAAEIPLLLFARDPGQVLQRYHVQSFADETSESFHLTPVSEDSPVTSLTIRFENRLPQSIRIENAMREHTMVELVNVALNPHLDSALFEFSTPAGIDVIDDRPGNE